ncbi:MAG TPA: hypothetical protein VFV93_16010, partial [Thermomicrobiales bacterium]|nr:hypothetical protein [Thermomicrobiales bacterium]
GPVALPAGDDDGDDALDFSLAREVGVLRLLLDRLEVLILTEADPERLVLPLTRLVESIARTIRIHSGVTGGPEDDLAGFIARAFDTLNLPGNLPSGRDDRN